MAIQSGENRVVKARRGDLKVETAWLLAGMRMSKKGGKGRSSVRRGLVMGTGSATKGEGRKKVCVCRAKCLSCQ